MELDTKPLVRPKFFGFILLVLLLPNYFMVLVAPESFRFTVGFVVPVSVLAIWCFASNVEHVGNLMTTKLAWILALACFTLGLVLHVSNIDSKGISWFISAFVFFMFTPVFYNLLLVAGLRVPKEGEMWK